MLCELCFDICVQFGNTANLDSMVGDDKNGTGNLTQVFVKQTG